jgi:hypothetical protein
MAGLRNPFLALGLLALIAPSARGQAVAFQPVVGTIPDGITLGVTPVVSADRRYVRMTLSPQFIDFTRFDTFSVPAAVSGGPGGGLGGIGGGLGGIGGGLGNLGGGAGNLGGGLAAATIVQDVSLPTTSGFGIEPGFSSYALSGTPIEVSGPITHTAVRRRPLTLNALRAMNGLPPLRPTTKRKAR